MALHHLSRHAFCEVRAHIRCCRCRGDSGHASQIRSWCRHGSRCPRGAAGRADAGPPRPLDDDVLQIKNFHSSRDCACRECTAPEQEQRSQGPGGWDNASPPSSGEDWARVARQSPSLPLTPREVTWHARTPALRPPFRLTVLTMGDDP